MNQEQFMLALQAAQEDAIANVKEIDKAQFWTIQNKITPVNNDLDILFDQLLNTRQLSQLVSRFNSYVKDIESIATYGNEDDIRQELMLDYVDKLLHRLNHTPVGKDKQVDTNFLFKYMEYALKSTKRAYLMVNKRNREMFGHLIHNYSESKLADRSKLTAMPMLSDAVVADVKAKHPGRQAKSLNDIAAMLNGQEPTHTQATEANIRQAKKRTNDRIASGKYQSIEVTLINQRLKADKLKAIVNYYNAMGCDRPLLAWLMDDCLADVTNYALASQINTDRANQALVDGGRNYTLDCLMQTVADITNEITATTKRHRVYTLPMIVMVA